MCIQEMLEFPPVCIIRKELHEKMNPLPLYQSGFNQENRNHTMFFTET